MPSILVSAIQLSVDRHHRDRNSRLTFAQRSHRCSVNTPNNALLVPVDGVGVGFVDRAFLWVVFDLAKDAP